MSEAVSTGTRRTRWTQSTGLLRKLNKAVEHQGEEMKRALMRIQTLEDELEEAWREEEGMAAEIDEMESDVKEGSRRRTERKIGLATDGPV
jgi:chromosome segregation ATPase